MPFDSLPQETKADPLTREQKLERLLYHLNLATDAEQFTYCQCLAHRCASDPVLIAGGLPPAFFPPFAPPKIGASRPWYEYFEISDCHECYGSLFGTFSVARKTAWVKSLLSRRRA